MIVIVKDLWLYCRNSFMIKEATLADVAHRRHGARSRWPGHRPS
jgi:hypothetical protein